MRSVVVAFTLLLAPACALAESITVVAPSLTVEPGIAGSFTVSAAFVDSFSVAGYNVTLSLVPHNGAKGVAFSDITKASESFLFLGSSWNGIGTNGKSVTPQEVYLQGYSTTDDGFETVANETRNVVKVTFNVASDASGSYDLTFISSKTKLIDNNATPFFTSYTNGTITVKTVPEPSTLTGLGTLAAIGLVAVGRRKGWALAA
jgi:hypothetical protein